MIRCERKISMTYYVIAIHWDEKVKAQVKYIAGEFPEYYLASIFRDAYNQKFSANSYIVNINNYINA